MRRYIGALIAASLIVGLGGCGKKEEQKEASKTRSAPVAKIKVTEGAVKETAKDTEKGKQNSGQFYYSYNEKSEKKGFTDEPPKERTTIDAYLHIRSPYERIRVEMMIKKLTKDFIVHCSPCHDDYANGVIGPSLLGKSGDFIYKQLIDFKTGKRKNVLMKELVSQIPDSQLKSIANEIAAFNAQLQKMRQERIQKEGKVQ